MDFCHIAPTKHLSLTDGRNTHLVLAHLIENDEQYVNYYLEQKKKYNCTLIMDNSAFEMYKQKKGMDRDKTMKSASFPAVSSKRSSKGVCVYVHIQYT